MSAFETFRRRLGRLIRVPVSLEDKASALIAGSANQSRLINEKSNAVIQGLNNQSRMLNEKLNVLIAAVDNQSRMLNAKLDIVIAALGHDPGGAGLPAAPSAPDLVPEAASASILPVADTVPHASDAALIAEKTYNTGHPDYDANLVRNFPTKILNADLPCNNRVYEELKKLGSRDEVTDAAWAPVLQSVFAEAKTVPHAELVLQRRDAIEQYIAELRARYNATYYAGWVNLDDALFLYWLVRKLKPKTIVQCGVCNGLSSAFMMLALAKNGPDGTLHVIDIPPVFNPKDPAWTVAGETYGVTIPEGKTSGWMVPEAYRKRFEVQNGDAKMLLPPLIDRLPAIDMFYHDSDHTYNHMMFEFREARRKLAPGGLIVADDISWNSSLWDFADENKVPAYNFKGAVGAAFF